MKLDFKAQLVGSEDTELDVLVVGAIDPDGRYVQFQRGLTKETDMDDPPYFELDDQINGGYGIVEHCILTDESMNIFLNQAQNGFDQIEVTLSSAKYDHQKLTADLSRIFRGYENILELDGHA